MKPRAWISRPARRGRLAPGWHPLGGGFPFAGSFLLAGILVVAGCTSQHPLRKQDMTPGRIHGRSIVYMKAGEQYQFRRISFVPDSLVGEIRVETEKRDESGSTRYVKEERTFRIPMADIDSVAVIKSDPGKTVLLGAGIAAGVALISNLADTSLPKKRSPTGGKDTDGGP